jgi:hypothetical protein
MAGPPTRVVDRANLKFSKDYRSSNYFGAMYFIAATTPFSCCN